MTAATDYDAMCKRLMDLGHDPATMTLKQMSDALGITPQGRSLFDAMGTDKPQTMYDDKGRHASKYATEYETYDGSDALQFTDLRFWVGVKSGVYPSPPVRRHATSCFSAEHVFRAGDDLVFTCNNGNTLYLVPECERWALQTTR